MSTLKVGSIVQIKQNKEYAVVERFNKYDKKFIVLKNMDGKKLTQLAAASISSGKEI